MINVDLFMKYGIPVGTAVTILGMLVVFIPKMFDRIFNYVESQTMISEKVTMNLDKITDSNDVQIQTMKEICKSISNINTEMACIRVELSKKEKI
jgi:hypothetical protein